MPKQSKGSGSSASKRTVRKASAHTPKRGTMGRRTTAVQRGSAAKSTRVEKVSASLDADLVREARATLASDESLSGLLNDALERALIARRGLAAVAEYEAEHGPLTDEELAEADRRLAAL